MLVWSLTSSSVSDAGAMLSLSDPSLVVRFVASMPLKKRLVLVVRVPLTEGEMLPVPLMSTGGRSALTPASDDSRCVKLPVDVGMVSSSAPVRLRAVVDVVMREQARVGGHLNRLGQPADLQGDGNRSGRRRPRRSRRPGRAS